ncbi:hypothetical protein ACFX2B_031667 [Malus domestica]
MTKIIWWKQQFLSQFGKETLIQAVAQAMPTYPINVFKLSKNLCRDIDAAIARFWKGQKEKERRIHWVNWDMLGSAKAGGLGFWNLREFNIALPNSPWARSSLLEGRDLLLQLAHWKIMSGDQTRLCVDRWIPNIPIGHPTPIPEVSMDTNQRVSSIIQPDSYG